MIELEMTVAVNRSCDNFQILAHRHEYLGALSISKFPTMESGPCMMLEMAL